MDVTPNQTLESNHFDQVALEYHFISTLFHASEFYIDNMPQSRTLALELGCGSGILVKDLAQYFDLVIGIDLSFELLSIAQHNNTKRNIMYLLMNIENLGLVGQFDYIVSSNVFHHLSDVESTLSVIKSLLKVGGRFVLTDVVSPNETPPRYVYIIGAYQEYLPNLIKYGWKIANRIFKFRTSTHWLNHLATDHYLTSENFQEIYSRYLPDCYFPDSGRLIWQKNMS